MVDDSNATAGSALAAGVVAWLGVSLAVLAVSFALGTWDGSAVSAILDGGAADVGGMLAASLFLIGAPAFLFAYRRLVAPAAVLAVCWGASIAVGAVAGNVGGSLFLPYLYGTYVAAAACLAGAAEYALRVLCARRPGSAA